MPYRGDSTQIPAVYSSDLAGRDPVLSLDPRVQLQNLSEVRARMDSLHGFLSKSISSNAPLSKDQIDTVDSEIASAIQQIVASGTALMASSRGPDPPGRNPFPVPKLEEEEEEEAAAAKIGDEEEEKGEMEIVELYSVELLAEHVHLCEICGKGFKRDANLRMHMRAHGNRFKTREALAKPNRFGSEPSGSRIRFSCPFPGCNRNKGHRKFRALKSAVCVRNHFKRSHCPKMYACNRCNRKSFSVLADLKTHLKHCGEAKWRCSCGTSFSRKDKLFGHIALFDGHLPAVIDENDKPSKSTSAQNDEEEEAAPVKAAGDSSCTNFLDDDEEFFHSLLNGFDSVQGFCLPDDLWSS